MKRFGSLWLALALVVLAMQPTVRADDKKADKSGLRDKALALNDVTGEEPIRGEIKALVDDPQAAKKLLAVAVPMAKEKDQPFNYNGAFILANTALRLKDLEASRTFFWVCAEQANLLQSSTKLGQSYTGLEIVIQLLQQDKKYEASAKLSQEFLEMMEKHNIVQEARGDVIFLMLKAWVKEGKIPEANKMLDGYLKGHENDWRRLKVKAEVKQEMEEFAEAVRTYEDLIPKIEKDGKLEKAEKKIYTEEGRLLLASAFIDWIKKGKAVEANKMLDSYLKSQEDDWQRVKVKAQVKLGLEDYAEAARAYEAMIPLIEKDSKLKNGDDSKKAQKDDVLYRLSNVYIELDQVDKAIEALQTLLAEKGNADNPSYNNDLGYVLADHDRELDNAEKMIRKALDDDSKRREKLRKKNLLSPENDHDSAAYLDSLGWVLFKKKNYPEAKKYLLLATQDKEEGQHVEILDHLVDVYLAMGEKAEAVAVLKTALAQEVTTKREKDRQAKMKKKLGELVSKKALQEIQQELQEKE